MSGDGEQHTRRVDFDDGIEMLEEIEVEEEAREKREEEKVKKQVGKKRKAAKAPEGEAAKAKGKGKAPEAEEKNGFRSNVWLEFIKVVYEGEGDPPTKITKARCKRCGKKLAADSIKNGTSTLLKHIESCKRRFEMLAKGKGGQTMLNLQPCNNQSGIGTLSTWRFDQEACRMRLCEMIIRDELPFRFVEREGFRRYTESLCPQFKIPSRHTIRADCVKLFLERKINLKSFFQQRGMGRVSITTDCWTSINNTNFICVTAHCIDRDWILHKKIINFKKICSHKGDDLGASIISSLEDWGLKKLLCCTMDNASANDHATKHMITIVERWKTNVLGGKYMHMRCAAHIINLVVSDGLDEIGMSVRRVREAVKWIKASPSRLDGFKGTLAYLKIPSTKLLCLDVPTR